MLLKTLSRASTQSFLTLSFSFINFVPILQMKCRFFTVTVIIDGRKEAHSTQVLLLLSSSAHLLCFSLDFLVSPFFMSVVINFKFSDPTLSFHFLKYFSRALRILPTALLTSRFSFSLMSPSKSYFLTVSSGQVSSSPLFSVIFVSFPFHPLSSF